jgi:hypothetical protein
MISFAAPWLLWGLLSLPLVIVLTRLRPPPLQRVRFPAFDLLPPDQGSRMQTPPLWLLILRLVMVATLVVGLAGPRWQTKGSAIAPNRIILVVDDSWAAAADWAAAMSALDSRLSTLPAATPITVVRTASAQKTEATAAAIRSDWKTWQPKPWRVNAPKTQALLTSISPAEIWYITDGLAHPDVAPAMAKLGAVTTLNTPAQLARIATVEPIVAGMRITLQRADTQAAMQGRIRVGDRSIPYDFAPGARIAWVDAVTAPLLQSVTIEGTRHAGAVWPLTAETRRAHIEVLSTPSPAPLSDADILLKALDGAGTIAAVPAARVTANRPDVIMVPDQRLDPAVRATLMRYVETGGTLVRFAGPILAQAPDGLTPAVTQQGARVLTGAVSWSKDLAIAPFAINGPFTGLTPPADVRVRASVAFPPEQEDRVDILARLTDGSPLISRKQLGQGQIVLVHTSAGLSWSDWPLSTHYRHVLHRLVRMAVGQAPISEPHTPCTIVQALDGFGNLAPAAGGDVPLAALREPATATTPPGVYRCGGVQVVYPVLPADSVLMAATPAPPAHTHTNIAFGGWMIFIAASLAMLDTLLRARAAILAVLVVFTPHLADAAADTTIGYIASGTSEDSLSKSGLDALSTAINTRTTAQIGPSMAIRAPTPEMDTLALIYWPVNAATPAPSTAMAQALVRYMGNGGMVWVDLVSPMSDTNARATLSRVLAPLSPPPLTALPQGHVITKSFYLIDECPGATQGAQVWVETALSTAHLDGVASLIVGQGNWRQAWAGGSDPAKREAALRCGINSVLYALVGNYKADQIHAKELIERLQRRGGK